MLRFEKFKIKIVRAAVMVVCRFKAADRIGQPDVRSTLALSQGVVCRHTLGVSDRVCINMSWSVGEGGHHCSVGPAGGSVSGVLSVRFRSESIAYSSEAVALTAA